MLKKIILSLLALIFIFVGSCTLLTGYLFFNPTVIFSGFEWFSNQAFKLQPFEEKQEFYLQGIEEIQIRSGSVPLKIEFHDDPGLEVFLQGQVQGEVKSLMVHHSETSTLKIDLMNPETFSSFHVQINGQKYESGMEAKVSATVALPSAYAFKVKIETGTAPVMVFFPDDYFTQLQLRSESGKVQNTWEAKIPPKADSHLAKKIFEIVSEKGDISIQDQNM